jgi:3',5'-cyclic-AMP phosphodiesterase
VSDSPVRLVQFTDLHLYGAADGCLRGVATLPAAEVAVATARRRHAPWDALLLTGDLVQDDPGGYARVASLFGDSDVPVYCIPGNHDEVDAMQAALARAPFQIGGTACHGNWLLVMLDSYLPGMAGGRISEVELARLDAALGANPQRHALVCLHHQPVPMHSRWLDAVSLENPAALFEVLDRHRNVRVLLWGHVHQAWEGARNGVQLLCTPSTCAQFKPLSDGFAIDRRPPGYRWFRLHADGRADTGVEWIDEAELARKHPSTLSAAS